MRTTLTLDDDLAVALKEQAQRAGRPFKQVVNDALRRQPLGVVGLTAAPKLTVNVNGQGAGAGQQHNNQKTGAKKPAAAGDLFAPLCPSQTATLPLISSRRRGPFRCTVP